MNYFTGDPFTHSGFKRAHQKDSNTGSQTWSVRDDLNVFCLANILDFRFIFANNIVGVMLDCFQMTFQ